MPAQVTVMQSSGQVASACRPFLGQPVAAASLCISRRAAITLRLHGCGLGMPSPGEEWASAWCPAPLAVMHVASRLCLHSRWTCACQIMSWMQLARQQVALCSAAACIASMLRVAAACPIIPDTV